MSDSNSASRIANFPISMLCLSSRSANPLIQAGITTVGELLATRSRGLEQVRWLGVKAISEIEEAINHLIEETSSLTDAELEIDNIRRSLFVGLDSKVIPDLSKIEDMPISVLNLSKRASNPLYKVGVTTIKGVLEERSLHFPNVRWLGIKAMSEIENALITLIESSSTMTNEELANLAQYGFLTPLQDNRPFLISIDSEAEINLLDVIVPFTKALLDSFGYTRELDVLRRRYGLDHNKLYTLQEIGDYYEITRERVRQLEFRATQKLQQAILGVLQSKTWRVPAKIIDEANNLSMSLKSIARLLTESEIISILENRYKCVALSNKLGTVRFLLSVLGLEPLPRRISGLACNFYPCWLTSQIDKSLLYQASKILHSSLLTSIVPLSFFDLNIQINRKRKSKIEAAYIYMAIKACEEVESIGEDWYQIKFEYLPSISDKSFRILHESNQPLHLRDISRQINHRLVKVGFPATVSVRSIQAQLVADATFACIGRSGIWSLSDWVGVSRGSIVDLMKEFFHVKQGSATADEVYHYVHSKRAGVAKKSIVIYLSAQNENFVRVSEREYELTEWGKKPYVPRAKNSSQEVHEKLDSGIRSIFGDQLQTLPLSELVHKLTYRTGIPTVTIYQRLRRSTLIRIEAYRSGKHQKRAVYIGDQQSLYKGSSSARMTIRSTVQQEVRNFLNKQRDSKALLSSIADYIIKTTGHKSKPSFYRYLSEMKDVEKEYTEKGIYCFLKLSDKEITAISFPQIDSVNDAALKTNLYRSIKLLNIDDVDLGLFQLGKMFETEIKAYLLEAKSKGRFQVTSNDLSRLVSMIDCVDRNSIIKKKHHLTLLREHRNERAHDEIPDLEERKKLLQHAPFLSDLYIDYIIFFNNERKKL